MIGSLNLTPARRILIGPHNKILQARREFLVSLRFRNSETSQTVYVIHTLSKTLLGGKLSMKAVKEELERMETLGVIERVTQPTSWCSGMVVVPKEGGRVRICVDLIELKTCPTCCGSCLVTVSWCKDLHKTRCKLRVLTDTSFSRVSTLTTFIMPFGRLCFCRLSFGITSAPEHLQRHMSES